MQKGTKINFASLFKLLKNERHSQRYKQAMPANRQEQNPESRLLLYGKTKRVPNHRLVAYDTNQKAVKDYILINCYLQLVRAVYVKLKNEVICSSIYIEWDAPPKQVPKKRKFIFLKNSKFQGGRLDHVCCEEHNMHQKREKKPTVIQ